MASAEQWELEALRARIRAETWRRFAELVCTKLNFGQMPASTDTDEQIRERIAAALFRFGQVVDWREPSSSG